MYVIRNKDGKPHCQFNSLRGIIDYTKMTSQPIKILAIDNIGTDGEAKFSILFEDGVSFEANFPWFNSLCHFVYRWRSAQGAPLLLNGEKISWDTLKIFTENTH